MGRETHCMKRIVNLLILLVVFILFALGCGNLENSYSEGEYFFVRHKGADMPVWVRGNELSDVILLYVHGGPGGSSVTYPLFFQTYQAFEEDFLTVYYDQRSSGLSSGIAGDDQFSIDQYIEDLDVVIDTIESRYANRNPKIFLVGHSWGGCLGTAYLLDMQRQEKIQGWIEMNGGHDVKTGMELSRQYVIDYVNLQFAEDEISQKEQQEVLNWYRENPVINIGNVAAHAGYVRTYYGYTPKGEESDIPMGEMIFTSQLSLQYLINSGNTSSKFDIWSVNLTESMDRITLPSLIVWGRHDGILPVPLAQQAYDALGTPLSDKYIEILPNSGHDPVAKDYDQFHNAVKTFINKYR